jgi:hypothetical protein
MIHTKGDTRVLVTNVLTLLVGKEHVCRETTLWRVGVCYEVSTVAILQQGVLGRQTLLLLFGAGLGGSLGLLLRHDEG